MTQRPLNVLIVEDEALLAMELESLVEESGHKVVGWAATMPQARALIDTSEIDLAFVDIHLQDGANGIDVARYIGEARPVTVVFLTANPKRIPEDFAGACGVISKPYSISALLGCMKYIEEAIRKPPPAIDCPSGLTLSPRYSNAWTTR